MVDLFEGHGFRVLVVGGMAMQLAGVAATSDVDLFLTTRDFDRLPSEFRRDRQVFALLSTGHGRVISGGLRTIEGDLRFAVLDPTSFSGNRSGAEFFDYVYRYWSYTSTLGRAVRPAVVWYSRLVLEGEAQLGRIVRDLEEGAPPKWFRSVQRIADRFGVGARVAQRIPRVQELHRIVRGSVSGEPSSR